MSYKAQSMSIYELMFDVGNYYLPAIQREFVWPIHKIEALFDSLLRGYPIGTLLRWDVRKPAIHDFQFYELIRNFDVRKSHNKKANLTIRDQCYGILDGQQRVASLYIGLMGSYREKLPRMRWNNPDAFPTARGSAHQPWLPGHLLPILPPARPQRLRQPTPALLWQATTRPRPVAHPSQSPCDG